MRKIMAVLLSLALLLGCAAGAEDAQKQIFGTIRINGEYTFRGTLPEGYRFVPFDQSDESVLFRLLSDDPTRPEMIMSIAFDETYYDVKRLDDLDEAQLALLEKTFTDTDPYAAITYDETEQGTRLMLVRTTSGDVYDDLIFFTIYDGYFVEFQVAPGEGSAEQRLTDEDIAQAMSFLSDMDFVSGIEEEELRLEGQTFTVNITGYDPAARTVDLTLFAPYRLTEWQVVSISEGDTIRLGTEDVHIDTLRYEGDDAIINDEYELVRNEDNYYTIRIYESPVLKEIRTLTVQVPDTLAYEEGIDPATGEMLDEMKELGADDLFAALAAAETDGVGFDSQTVSVTFGDQGEPVKIVRDYAPWQ